MMGSREGLRERGIQRGSRLVRDLATEWHGLRLAAGVSQKELARALGISRETYSRIERGKTPAVTVARAAAITAILGSELSVKTYPIGQPIRDKGQLAVLERFEQPLAPTWRVTHEAPMSVPGDLRAWDVRLDGPVSIGIEAETRPYDLQALERRMHLKERDSGVRRMLLLVPSTDRNRALLRSALPMLRRTFPLATREVMRALRDGNDPGANGIVVL